MKISTMLVLIDSLFHDDGELVKGQNLVEWFDIAQQDYDEIDREMIDSETNGGA